MREPKPAVTAECHDPRRKEPAISCRVAAATFAVLLLGAAGPLRAATTRTEDQRLVWQHAVELPEGSQLGTTLAMGGGISGFPYFGVAGTSVAGAGAIFRHPLAGSAWTHDWIDTPSAVQAYPVATDSVFGVIAHRNTDGTHAVRWWLASTGSFGVLVPSLADPVEALAMHGQTGGFLAVGQPSYLGGRGRVQIYEEAFGEWNLAATWVGEPGERLGTSLAAKDLAVVAGAPGREPNGAVYEYVRATEWLLWQRIDSPALAPQTGAAFGAAVALTSDGWLAVGSPDVDRLTSPGAATDVGAVYLYKVVFLLYELQALLRPPDATDFDHFGASLALDDRSLAAGSPGRDGALQNEGAAYVYRRAGSAWQTLPFLRLVDSSPEAEEALGTSVAVGGYGALAGAPNFDGNGVLDQGAVLFHSFRIFADDFDGGDFSAWSEVVP
jgi:hypothetical protein